MDRERETHTLSLPPVVSSLSRSFPRTISNILSIPFSRFVQKAELTRLAQTFLHVPQLHWILVEDSPHKTPLVSGFLASSGLAYTHLHTPTPRDRKLQEVGSDPVADQAH